MNPFQSTLLRNASSLAVAGFLTGSALAQGAFTVSGLSVSPRLTPMVGGGFVVAEPSVGDTPFTAAGGGFTLEASTTPLPQTIAVPGEVSVVIMLDGGAVTLSWPESGDGYVLESAVAIDTPAGWQPVTPAPAGRSFTVPATEPARFFRLRRR
jgi:hypothetical protein